jgi:hypothetical protein
MDGWDGMGYASLAAREWGEGNDGKRRRRGGPGDVYIHGMDWPAVEDKSRAVDGWVVDAPKESPTRKICEFVPSARQME